MSKRPADVTAFDVFVAVWQRRYFVIGVAIVITSGGFGFALLSEPVYRAEVVLAPRSSNQQPRMGAGLDSLAGLVGVSIPSSSDQQEAVAVLRSRALLEEFIVKENLLPELFRDNWDPETSTWVNQDSEGGPDVADGVRFFSERVRSVREDTSTGMITLWIDWTNPERSAEWANALVDLANATIRARDLAEIDKRLAELDEQLRLANLLELRQAIASVIEEQIQARALAFSNEEYAFRVIDPAVVPKEKIRPARALLVVASAFIGFVVGMLLVIGLGALRSVADAVALRSSSDHES